MSERYLYEKWGSFYCDYCKDEGICEGGYVPIYPRPGVKSILTLLSRLYIYLI